MKNSILPRSFYERDTVIVAQQLLGNILIRHWQGVMLGGIIAEVEAYGGKDDPASHACTKKTPRNAAMFGPVGHAYVYFIYGNHHCLNLVARDVHARAGGVLIRGLLPIYGIEEMQQARGFCKYLTDGPGKICQALRITPEHNGKDVTQDSELYVIKGGAISPDRIEATPRVGIVKARDKHWRFVLKNA